MTNRTIAQIMTYLQEAYGRLKDQEHLDIQI